PHPAPRLGGLLDEPSTKTLQIELPDLLRSRPLVAEARERVQHLRLVLSAVGEQDARSLRYRVLADPLPHLGQQPLLERPPAEPDLDLTVAVGQLRPGAVHPSEIRDRA